MASMRSRSPLASVRPGAPASMPWSLRVQMIRSPAPGVGAVADRDGGPVLDDAEVDQVVADPAVQLAAQRVIGGHQQDVGAARGQGDVGGRGGVHDLLGVAADDAAVLVVLGQDRGVAVAEPQAGGAFPRRGTGRVRRAGRSRAPGRAATCRRRSPPPASWPGSPARMILAPPAWRRRSGRPGPGWTASRPRRSPSGCPGRWGRGRGRRGCRAGGPGTGRRCTTRGLRRRGCCGPTGTG